MPRPRTRCRTAAPRSSAVAALSALALAGAGCLNERSFTFRGAGTAGTDRVVEVVAANPSQPAGDVRAWLVDAYQRLAPLLPPGDPPALLTDDLVCPEGRARNVCDVFRVDPAGMNSIFTNYHGLIHSAQGTGAREAIDTPADPWPGFEDVWIPVNDRVRLSARIGYARDEDGRPIEADCIVLLPGLLGDLAVQRTRDMARALIETGRHALAIELRGFGQTERTQPHVYYTFGVLESGDLLAVDEWLQRDPAVRETGLVGFCWGANHAVLAAWEDARPDDDPMVAERLRPYLRPRDGRPHFKAGVIAYSATIDFEPLVDRLRGREFSPLTEPVLATLQKGIRARMQRKRHPEISGDLGRLIDFEFAASELNYDGSASDGYRFLRLLPYKDEPWGDKLECVRVPVLIVHAVNDPLASPQAVAELVARTDNRNVAAIVLPGGGHVGFAPYSRDFFYGLFLEFFDARRGAAASQSRAAATSVVCGEAGSPPRRAEGSTAPRAGER